MPIIRRPAVVVPEHPWYRRFPAGEADCSCCGARLTRAAFVEGEQVLGLACWARQTGRPLPRTGGVDAAAQVRSWTSPLSLIWGRDATGGLAFTLYTDPDAVPLGVSMRPSDAWVVGTWVLIQRIRAARKAGDIARLEEMERIARAEPNFPEEWK